MVSAHRMPTEMVAWGQQAHTRGLSVVIAGAGGAAHLPGMLASLTPLPVIGVPVPLKYLDGMDSLLSIVQMPGGIPVATVAIGNAKNAGILAARILATSDPELQQRLVDYQDVARRDRARQGRGRPPGRGRRHPPRVGLLVPVAHAPAQGLGPGALLLRLQPPLLRAAGRSRRPARRRRRGQRLAQQVGEPLARRDPVAVLRAVLGRGDGDPPRRPPPQGAGRRWVSLRAVEDGDVVAPARPASRSC